MTVGLEVREREREGEGKWESRMRSQGDTSENIAADLFNLVFASTVLF